MTDTTLATPWYRQRWPWLLMIMPATALFSGIFTWWLAATTNNSLVVDDYYREGRAINQQLARDDRAAQLGLRATLQAGAGGVTLQLQASTGEPGFPPSLNLRLVHATDAALDAQLTLQAVGDGSYRAPGALPASGHWTIHLEDPQREWRLLARADRFSGPITLVADPVIAGGRR